MLLKLLFRIISQRFFEVLRSLWPVITVLFVFQYVFFRQAVEHPLQILLGLGWMILGLMLFLEGLRMGLMPLAENIGALLPTHFRLGSLMLIAFMLGWGATLAEPAIASLAFAAPPDMDAMPDHPLNNSLLPQAIGCGVGVGLALGMLKIYKRWPLYRLVLPTLLVAAFLSAASQSYGTGYLNVAWDAGAVTTGPVTVPVILALGLGVSQVMPNEGRSGLEGFGLVTLASLWPVIMVLLLGLYT